ncbi:hypothetical protein FACS1894103_6920 [Campylobacterota bacterium]|nr:hypothetical protein FACS1894103_6920 [Campylobacterota bacterium]
MSLKRAIISGSHGFIGSALKLELENYGYETYDPNYDTNLPKTANVYYHFKWFVKSETTNTAKQIESIDIAINAIEQAHKMGCDKFIYASSIMEHEVWRLYHTDFTKLRAVDVYAAAKFCAAVFCRVRAEALGITFIPMTITNIYGAGEKAARFINSTLRKIKERSKEPLTFSAGTQNYDFVYVTDAAKAFAALADRGAAGRNYLLGSGNARKLREFIDEMLLEFSQELDGSPQPIFGAYPTTIADLDLELFDISDLQADTGYHPQIGWREGLRRTYESLS